MTLIESGGSKTTPSAPEAKPKPRRRRLVLVLLLLAVGAAAPALVWLLEAPSPWRVCLLDKTVSNAECREHASLVWVLNHAKVAPPGGIGPWVATRDYLGYDPAAGVGTLLSPERLGASDLLYIVDAYGVYASDLGPVEGQDRLLFGGIEGSEVDVIEAFVKRGGSLIAEFNTFASPTKPAERARLEALLGLKWTGWSGRRFVDLSDKNEVPAWARTNWRVQEKAEWEFRGAGIVFTHDDRRIQVLADGTDEGWSGPQLFVTMPGDPLMAGVTDRVPYHYWFDIVEPAAGSEVLAEYRLKLTDSGLKKMTAHGLPATFPAVVRVPGSPMRLYLAGDFSDTRIAYGPVWIAGWPAVRGAVTSMSQAGDASPFFWGFYVPFLGNVFRGR